MYSGFYQGPVGKRPGRLTPWLGWGIVAAILWGLREVFLWLAAR